MNGEDLERLLVDAIGRSLPGQRYSSQGDCRDALTISFELSWRKVSNDVAKILLRDSIIYPSISEIRCAGMEVELETISLLDLGELVESTLRPMTVNDIRDIQRLIRLSEGSDELAAQMLGAMLRSAKFLSTKYGVDAHMKARSDFALSLGVDVSKHSLRWMDPGRVGDFLSSLIRALEEEGERLQMLGLGMTADETGGSSLD